MAASGRIQDDYKQTKKLTSVSPTTLRQQPNNTAYLGYRISKTGLATSLLTHWRLIVIKISVNTTHKHERSESLNGPIQLQLDFIHLSSIPLPLLLLYFGLALYFLSILISLTFAQISIQNAIYSYLLNIARPHVKKSRQHRLSNGHRLLFLSSNLISESSQPR